jgi:purine nucleoside phosphorylase
MSTVPEVTVCHHLGIGVLGVSLITNLAAHHVGGHQKVIDFAAAASKNLSTLISGVIDAL